MKKFIKLVPLMALLFGLGVYTVDAKLKAENVLVDQEWMLQGANQDQPDSYIPAPPGTQNDCQRDDETLCIVLAPADAEGKPDFDAVPNLESALSSDAEHPNIIRGPYNP